jgi:hypothetical protein
LAWLLTTVLSAAMKMTLCEERLESRLPREAYYCQAESRCCYTYTKLVSFVRLTTAKKRKRSLGIKNARMPVPMKMQKIEQTAEKTKLSERISP